LYQQGFQMRFLRRTSAVLVAVLVFLCGLWGTGALYFRAADHGLPGGLLSLAFGMLSLFAVICLVFFRIRVALVWAFVFAGLLIWWQGIQPSHDRDWAAVVERLPRMSITGDIAEIRNIRNFIWRSDTDFEPRWESRRFQVLQVQGVDLFLSYWTGPSIAHLIVSLDVRDEVPLAFSIEIRREKTEEYSALAGFFKSYELVILALDERDVVKLRTNVWKEDVRLYRLGVGPEKAQALLRGYAREIEAIAQAPLFYNTLTGNCTNIAYRLARELWPALKPDWRVLLSGHLPELAYEIGAVDTRISLDELKEKAKISEKARSIGDAPDFSALIRDGVPKP
jgi:Domain of unknown function (DUF4105)